MGGQTGGAEGTHGGGLTDGFQRGGAVADGEEAGDGGGLVEGRESLDVALVGEFEAELADKGAVDLGFGFVGLFFWAGGYGVSSWREGFRE